MPAQKRTQDQVTAEAAAAAQEQPAVPEGYTVLPGAVPSEIWSEKAIEISEEKHEGELKELRGAKYEEDKMFSSDGAGYAEMSIIEDALMDAVKLISKHEAKVKKQQPTTDAAELAQRKKADDDQLKELYHSWWPMVDDGERFRALVKLLGAGYHYLASSLQAADKLNADCQFSSRNA